MAEALNDWNTRFPRNVGDFTQLIDDMAGMGYDVHTVQIQLNNGGWHVEVQSTDGDMGDFVKEFELNFNGGIDPV